MSRLERRYRRLLLCYPRSYRRARADEIVGTLLDLAPPGRTRPTVREAVNLLRQGLRARLGRPASRTVVVWASLASVLCGLITGSLAAHLGWAAARPLPSVQEARAILTDTLPGHPVDRIHRGAALFVIYGQPLSWDNADTLLTLDAGEYEFANTGVVLNGLPPIPHEQTLRVAQDNLRAAGWRLYRVRSDTAVDCAGPPCNPSTLPLDYTLMASRGDNILTLKLIEGSGLDTTYLVAEIERATPWAVHVAAVAGVVLGFLGGWMLFGWASRRTEGRPAVRALASVMFTLVLLLWGVPCFVVPPMLLAHHLGEPHPRWHQLWEWIGLPSFAFIFVVGLLCALLALAIAALPRLPVREARRDAPA
ncbi:hypothetical protein [Allorhizocola rhizosphaerae]|uniref:hypothetical protein n=1 Tax=Allorhizocola rhizosphaerae TaxID=1872709 RepID=UPI0013C2D19B|nr:hypothetical protein [Allorhizocola rhizosphaerae]